MLDPYQNLVRLITFKHAWQKYETRVHHHQFKLNQKREREERGGVAAWLKQLLNTHILFPHKYTTVTTNIKKNAFRSIKLVPLNGQKLYMRTLGTSSNQLSLDRFFFLIRPNLSIKYTGKFTKDEYQMFSKSFYASIATRDPRSR